ncbi:MAG: hypothetical protein IT462_14855 [Planctomycetes bacterium]|nr:hypothetical protein [Planctomycetota bacterium]
MKRLFAATGLIAVLALSGCGDNSGLRKAIDENNQQIAALQDQVAKLSSENARLSPKAEGAAHTDVSKYEDAIARLQDVNAKLEARLAAVEGRKPADVAGAPEAPVVAADSAAADKSYDDYRANRAREEREKVEARQRELDAMALKAKEYGLEFDPKDAANSLRKLMQNRETRDKVVEAARVEARKERYKKIGVDEGQAMRLQQIEDDARKKFGDLWRGRDGGDGVSREEREKQIEVVRNDADSQVKQLLTPEQYKVYGEQGGLGAANGGWGGNDFVNKMFPGVLPEGGWGGGPGGR